MSTGYIDLKYTHPDYSTKLLRAYLNYLRRNYSEDVFFESLKDLRMPSEYVLKDGNWVSENFMIDFRKKIKEKTGNENIAEDVGSTFLSADNINSFEFALIKLMPPELFFLITTFTTRKVNKRLDFIISSFRLGRVQVEIKSRAKDPHNLDICKNTIGMLTGVLKFYGTSNSKVIHKTCIHRGDGKCTFDVSYSSLSYWRVFFLKTFAFFGSGYAFTHLTRYIAQNSASVELLVNILTIAAFVPFALLLFGIGRFYDVIRHHMIYQEQSEEKEGLIQQSREKLDRRYHEGNLLRELSMSLILKDNPKDVVSSCVNNMNERFKYSRLMIMLLDSEKTKLYPVEVSGFGEATEILYKVSIVYPAKKNDPQFFANILETGKTVLLDNMESYKTRLNEKNQKLMDFFKVSSMIVSPINDSYNKYGLLIVGSVEGDRLLGADDRHLIENVTNMLSLFFRNAGNFEREKTLRTIFQKYVPSVVMDNLARLDINHSGGVAPKSNTITSMFIDLRSFTSISETLPPEKLVELLNIYIDEVTKVIARFGGIIDNLMGDGIVAFFPATDDPRVDHARKAVECSIHILAHIETMNKILLGRGLPNIRLGIGLHCGNATVGNIGGTIRVNYTAIGDTVNVAGRLEALCKKFSTTSESAGKGLVILSTQVQSRAKLFGLGESIGDVDVRGRVDKMSIYLIDQAQATHYAKIPTESLFDFSEDEVIVSQEKRKTDRPATHGATGTTEDAKKKLAS